MHENSNVEKRLRIPKILRTLYSPSKVFKELAENPSYRGVVLILILFIASNTFAVYALYTKRYIQKVKPNLFVGESDIWTENATLWNSTGSCTESNDSVYGEYSINCTVTNESELYMRVILPETINCSAHEFNKTSFSLKLLNSSDNPANMSLILFSENNGHFIRSLDKEIKEIEKWDNWNNITVPLGEKEDEWIRKGNASWHTINSVELLIKFSKKVNATLLLDALFFQGQYESQVNYFAYYVILYGMHYFVLFIVFWVVFGGLLYILTKYAGSNLTWKHTLMISSYSLTSLFVQGIFWAILFLFFLPQINFQIDAPRGIYVPKEIPAAAELIFNLLSYSQFAFLAWGIVISTFAVRTLSDLTIGKSVMISLASYLTAFFLAGALSPF